MEKEIQKMTNIISDMNNRKNKVLEKLNEMKTLISQSNTIAQKQIIEKYINKKNNVISQDGKHIATVNDLITELLKYDRNTLVNYSYEIIDNNIKKIE